MNESRGGLKFTYLMSCRPRWTPLSVFSTFRSLELAGVIIYNWGRKATLRYRRPPDHAVGMSTTIKPVEPREDATYLIGLPSFVLSVHNSYNTLQNMINVHLYKRCRKYNNRAGLALVTAMENQTVQPSHTGALF